MHHDHTGSFVQSSGPLYIHTECWLQAKVCMFQSTAHCTHMLNDAGPAHSPLQLDLMGHVSVLFEMRYALSVVRLGDLRSVSSSFFHTYVIAVCSYETNIKQT